MSHLSTSRIRTIMKTANGANSINKEAILVVKDATELFIKQLTAEGYTDKKRTGGRSLSYKNLVNVVHGNSCYEFLEYMIPKKITVREFKELMRRKQAGEESSEEESDETSECDASESNKENE